MSDESEEDSPTPDSGSQYKKLKRGDGWEHFDKIYKGTRIDKARCHLCHVNFSIGYRTRIKHQYVIINVFVFFTFFYLI